MTREEAIKTLRELWRETNDSWYEEVYDMAIEALSADRPTKHTLPDGTEIDIDEESYEIGYTHGQMADRPTGEWIPVSERLPKEKQEVYVTVYFTEGDTGRAYGYVDGFGRWHLYSTVEGTLNSGYDVTAWMPLPEPYKDGDTE